MPRTEIAVSAEHEVLFTPLSLGPLRLRNRLIMAPMGTSLDNGGHITEDAIAYYVRRARGGVGTITVEGCLISPETVGPEPKICGPEYLPGLRRLVAALRAHDITIGVQLMHPGRQVLAGPSVAPSPVPLHARAPAPSELSEIEIERIVQDYARAAALAIEAGFDFVEVHGAHGYLPSNFLSPLDNRRSDGYGGDRARRARFCVEVARAIVARGGDRLPLVWRLNGEDAIAGGLQLEDATAVAQLLEAEGVVAISVTAGTWHTLDVTLAPMSVARGHLLGLAAAIRGAIGIPVIAVGRLDDPGLAAGAIAAGAADLICIGRGLIAEPDWPEKVRSGRLRELRPCIACNACVDRVGRGEPARCAVNPEAGREREWTLAPAARQRRVMVVGSGPAGMEAARIARLRGHEVSLWESHDELGGKLEIAARAPSKGEVLRFRDYQVQRLGDLGVSAHTGVCVTPALVAEHRPEVVLIATGADPLLPPIPGLQATYVHDALLYLAGEITIAPGEHVAIIGGSATGCETAEALVAAGARVTILEMHGEIGRGIEAITRRRLLQTLRADGVTLLTRATVVAVEDHRVVYDGADGARQTLTADHVALALGWRPRGDELADVLREDFEVVVLGDAAEAADFVQAINSGADAGLAL
jgi:2,4-dienoyl-CoA reductase-like NADH-dependent reductase (Old Yellow Enzyme family)/thioredoxin reductase